MPTALKTRKRYKMMGNDFSSQEVRMFAANTQDPAMIKVFNEGRDLYSEVASMVYHLPYNQCTEFDENGEFNLEGKKRRTACKSLILGLQYGRGIGSIAEQIKSHPGPVTKEDKAEAQKLSDDFFHNYPMAKKWMEGNYEKAEKQGYVEDLWGRRRRLPDASLPKYQFELASGEEELDNPLLGSVNKKVTISKALINKYTTQLDKARSKEAREVICAEALKEGIKIKCNSGYIAQARRQSINAPIQGGSATMTKLAMRDMHYDEELNKMGFHLLIPVHDEVIAEAPAWYAEEANKRMAYLMVHAGEPECKVPMKCDGDCWDFWYQDVIDAHIEEDFSKAINKGKSSDEALLEVQLSYSEFTPEYVKKVLADKL